MDKVAFLFIFWEKHLTGEQVVTIMKEKVTTCSPL